MKSIERRLPQEIDKSFIVFKEVGKYFPDPWHYHPEFELVLIRSSTGRRMVGDHIGFFDAGDLVFMGPLIPHVWVNDPEYINGESTDVADAIVIQFLDNFLGDNFMSIPEMEEFRNFLRLSNRGMVIKGKAKELINSLMTEIVSSNGLQRLSILLKIFDILAHTKEYELLASPSIAQNIPLKTSDQFSRINEYIMRNFQDDISLSEISSVANMAVTTFCNFFKHHYRITFVEYLNTVKIGHACKLLGEDGLNIVEVAYKCGYNNLANFNKQFKKLKGMTPSEFRKQLNVSF
ncbi:MAG TPA: AraC family transcriptional regulator [Sphingobacteriaceae bacterium]|nr:AraC family transcriptional regulator [Sphingobacteriaceae bacterium]